MSTPAPNENEPSRMKKIMSSPLDESIKSRLPRGNGVNAPTPTLEQESTPESPPAPVPPPVNQPANDKEPRYRWKFLPAFWTIASIMSFTVNLVLLLVVLLLLQNRAPVGAVANDQVTRLLGGLYDNFVLMDQATINKQIVVDANIPLDIIVPVNLTNKEITLATDTVISRAHVEIYQGGVNINAPAKVTLPAGTKLNIDLNFDLPVRNTIPVHLEVPVSIPLRETDLHKPFVGLQEVVKPWYCVMQPNAVAPDATQVCVGVPNPLAPVFDLLPNE